MGNEYQSLTVHSKKGRRKKHHHQGKNSHQKGSSKLICYTCDEIGHFTRKYPMNRNGSKKKNNSKKKHHAHTTEDDDPPRKRTKQESEDEYVLIFALMELSHMGARIGLLTVGLPST